MKRATYETFGCERVKLTTSAERKLTKLGLKNAIAVPIRMKGLSSQGDLLRCITNVEKMVARYGGQVLIGMTYKDENGSRAWLGRHAVWITPEGKAVCITKANYKGFGGNDPIIYNSKMEKCVHFVPMSVYTQEEVYTMMSEGTKTYDWRVNAVSILSSSKFHLHYHGEKENYEVVNARKCVSEIRRPKAITSMELAFGWMSGEFLRPQLGRHLQQLAA